MPYVPPADFAGRPLGLRDQSQFDLGAENAALIELNANLIRRIHAAETRLAEIAGAVAPLLGRSHTVLGVGITTVGEGTLRYIHNLAADLPTDG